MSTAGERVLRRVLAAMGATSCLPARRTQPERSALEVYVEEQMREHLLAAWDAETERLVYGGGTSTGLIGIVNQPGVRPA